MILGAVLATSMTLWADTPRAATLLTADEAQVATDGVMARRLELEASRPALKRPVLTTVAGIAGVLVGFGLLGSGFAVGYFYAFSAAWLGVVLVVFGGAVAVAGIVFTVLGAVAWVRTARARRAIDAEIEQLDAPQPAPPAPPDALPGPTPGLTLARF